MTATRIRRRSHLMEEITPVNTPYTVTSKTRVLIALALLIILSPFLIYFAMWTDVAYALANIALSIGVLVCCIIWVHIDANEKNIPVGSGLRLGMILLMPPVLIYYFYKSRGFKYGSLTLLKAIGFYLVTNIVAGIVATILSIIDGSFWKL